MKKNTEDPVRNLITNHLHINTWIEFGNVHRFGHGAKPGKNGKPKPKVARFIYYKDLAGVPSNTYSSQIFRRYRLEITASG